MDKKIKRLFVISVSFIIMTGCTPTNTNNNNRNASITHTHNGVSHTHRLPTEGLKHSHNIGQGGTQQTCQPCANNNNNGNRSSGPCHVHAGKRHCHPLPASGAQHTHTAEINEQANNPVIIYRTSSTIPYPTNTAPPIDPYYQPTPYPAPISYPTEPPYQPTPYSENNNNPPQNWTNTNSSCDTQSGNYYVVRPKDGVYRIGVNKGVKRNDIIRLNNLQSPDYTIQPGQCLRLR